MDELITLRTVTQDQQKQLSELTLLQASMSALWAHMDERMRRLEQERTDVTVLHKDVLIIMARIRARADIEAAQHRVETRSLRSQLKKAVLQRYGIRDLHDLPRNKNDEALRFIDSVPMFRMVLKARETK